MTTDIEPRTNNRYIIWIVLSAITVAIIIAVTYEQKLRRIDDFYEAVIDNNISGVMSLYENDPGLINASYGYQKESPLHYAVYKSHRQIAEFLISNGADVNAKASIDGTTPLHWMAMSGQCELMELLISKGANVNARDDLGKTPLKYATERRYTAIAEILRRHGAKE